MPNKKTDTNPIHRFGYRHYQTDGKLENIYEALDQAPIDTVCLALTDPQLDPHQLTTEQITARLNRAQIVTKKLRLRGFTVQLALPSLLDPAAPADLKSTLKLTAQTSASVIWIDDSAILSPNCPDHKTILQRADAIRAAVHSVTPRARIGLIAAEPAVYLPAQLTPAQIALALANNHPPLLTQSQNFTTDTNRAAILQAAQTLAVSAAQLQTAAASQTKTAKKTKSKSPSFIGLLDHESASSFHKSAEAFQMQTNLNLLLAADNLLLNCFDHVGTAPGTENPFLTMQSNRHKFLNKLKTKLPVPNLSPAAITIIVPDDLTDWPSNVSPYNAWPTLLWRLGLPISFVAASALPTQAKICTAYVLTGHTPAQLSSDQLNHVFHQGVLLDSVAAQTLQKLDRADLLGIKLGPNIKNPQLEIFSDALFAPSHYAYHSIICQNPAPANFHSIQPVSTNTRTVTTISADGRPNLPGLTCFDDQPNNRRAVILPYSINQEIPPALLTVERQRQFTDIFAYLRRAPLPCYVENTPDLIPFYIPVPKTRSAILALLNISFDWAIDSRIRLHNLPVPCKKVRELSEDGKITPQPEIGPHQHRQYQFLQLSPDTAVPPLQMTILLLE